MTKTPSEPSVPEANIADMWQKALGNMNTALADLAQTKPKPVSGKAYDPTALLRTMTGYAFGLAADPKKLMAAQNDAVKQWADFWGGAFMPKEDTTPPVEIPRSDRRFSAPEWEDNPYFRSVRDAYLIAAKQMREMVADVPGLAGPDKAMGEFLLDQYLNAIAPTNFPMTNPDVVKRTAETGGANLVAGFANLLQDVAAGKGVVKRRTSDIFRKGETIAATPGSVVFQNDLFQLIQYDPATPDVHETPLVYVPPLVNRYYMIDLQPKSSLVKWLVDQGRTVFVISWVNPGAAHRDNGVAEYVRDGIVEAMDAARAATGAKSVDLFSFCLGGTLVAVALAWLAAQKREKEANSATLIGSMVDFGDMRDWSAFVHEAHLDALDNHLEKQGFIDSTELQQLFSAVRANDLIWSSVVNHYLLDKEAPASDLLYWFEDGARIPQAFLTSYNRGLLHGNKLTQAGAFEMDGVAIDLGKIKTPVMLIALKDDHVSAWEAVYAGAKLFGGKVTFVLGGSGHNAGVINPPAANKHGYWTGDKLAPSADAWLDKATRHEGSWWPHWDTWLSAQGVDKMVPARKPGSGKLKAIEPAPGSYVRMD